MTATHRALAWLAVLLPFCLLAASHWGEGRNATDEDDAQYLLHAKAIAEGRPYTDIGFIFTPFNRYVGPEAEPPGLPLVLAPLVVVAGPRSGLIKLFMLACALALIGVVARYFALLEDGWLALGTVLLCCLQPRVVHSATLTITDLPFAALVWGVALLADRPGPWRAGRIAAICALGAAAITFRIAGVALIPAIVIYAVMRFRHLRLWPVIPVVVYVGAYAVTTGLLPVTSALMPEVSLTPHRLAASMAQNLAAYKYGLLETLLYPFPGANHAYHVVTLILLVVGLVAWLRHAYGRFLAIFAAVYVGMLLIIPTRDSRYLWPLAPLIVFAALNGGSLLVRLAQRSWPATRANAIALAASAVVAALSVASSRLEPPAPGITTVPAVQSLYARLEALTSGQTIRVMVFRPRILTLETGIPAMPLFVAPPDTLVEELCLRRITHVVLGDLGQYPLETAALRAALQARPQAFDETYENGSFAVYRFTGQEVVTQAGPSRTCDR